MPILTQILTFLQGRTDAPGAYIGPGRSQVGKVESPDRGALIFPPLFFKKDKAFPNQDETKTKSIVGFNYTYQWLRFLNPNKIWESGNNNGSIIFIMLNTKDLVINNQIIFCLCALVRSLELSTFYPQSLVSQIGKQIHSGSKSLFGLNIRLSKYLRASGKARRMSSYL